MGRTYHYLLLIFVASAYVTFPTTARAKPHRASAELDLAMRAEWDGDLRSYVQSIKEERRSDALARAEQRRIRAQDEKEKARALRDFVTARARRTRAERLQAARAVYFEELRYRQEQDRIRQDFVAQKNHARDLRQQTRQSRVNNFRAVRLALIQLRREEKKLRSPAMLTMPKPDTAALKANADGSSAQFAPTLPAPSIDSAGTSPSPATFNDSTVPGSQPFVAPNLAHDQSVATTPTYAPNGADSARAFGGNAR